VSKIYVQKQNILFPACFLFFLKVLPAILLNRQTVQTRVQTTAEIMSATGMGGIRNGFFGQFIAIFAITSHNIYNNTLHSWTPRNIMGGICKKTS
jgi:hypothetical protein